MRLGTFTPDYTAYEDLLAGVPRVRVHHIELAAESGFAIAPSALGEEIRRHGLRALLLSNLCNPTGRVLRGEVLAGWIAAARKRRVTLLLDEYYPPYVWNGPAPVSAARYVENVDEDPVWLFDGLTKNYHYPGWRIGWTLGPRGMIETLARAGSALHGGASRWEQRAALPLLEPDRAQRETQAMRDAFRPKRDLLVARLKERGMVLAREPEGTFYGWASVAGLPRP